jgi:hypothetical protein
MFASYLIMAGWLRTSFLFPTNVKLKSDQWSRIEFSEQMGSFIWSRRADSGFCLVKLDMGVSNWGPFNIFSNLRLTKHDFFLVNH